MLAADASGCDVVDPDHVGVVHGDGVAAPDVLGVDVGDGDVSRLVVSFGIWDVLYGIWRSVSYWMITLFAPLTIRRPLPLMTPALPLPTMDLLDLTVMPREPALSLERSISIRSKMWDHCNHGSWGCSY